MAVLLVFLVLIIPQIYAASIANFPVDLDSVESTPIENDPKNGEFNSILTLNDPKVEGLDSNPTLNNPKVEGLDSNLTLNDPKVKGLDSNLTLNDPKVKGLESNLTLNDPKVKGLNSNLTLNDPKVKGLDSNLTLNDPKVEEFNSIQTINDPKVEGLNSNLTLNDPKVEELNSLLTLNDPKVEPNSDLNVVEELNSTLSLNNPKVEGQNSTLTPNDPVVKRVKLDTWGVTTPFDPVEAGCNLDQNLRDEISSHQEVVDKIVDYVLNEDKGQTYNKLAEFVDKFGARMSGSQALEDAIDYLLERMRKLGLDNVRGEEVTVPHWVRGREKLRMIEPRNKTLAVLGLGLTVGTPPEGITAEALVVNSFDELENKKDQVRGKIVVYTFRFERYGQAVAFRKDGGRRAAELGAVAALVQSVTDFSLYTPHTGMSNGGYNVTRIPTASITVEDAKMLFRMTARGKKIVLHLEMEAETLPDAISRNTVAEIQGELYPHELVIIGAHVDSWDIGQGAMDDGGGVFVSYRALEILRKLGLRPKRTLRTVLWTAEEVDLVGAEAYFQEHKQEADNISLAMETDYGSFKPLGLSLGVKNLKSQCIMKEVLNLLSKIDADRLFIEKFLMDLSPFDAIGVPTGALKTANSKYFYYHHTEADTMAMMDPDHLDLCLAVWTAASYVVANLEEKLPRT